ncbi:uncharacterized protein C8R40DRAFT_1237012 [Lentinula edodes]|uniref:uncharacterized protein n=1 Tax=Lentinula edodes TaxID=5353 RepID=UPI001E8DBC62|nr:uncharacterized protein C8R40DRAFT_1237012 [Lentinula edodes]KAH7875650.1 hypothetical protein C8R40DRAFT_1237012 [Lentinula edodes]
MGANNVTPPPSHQPEDPHSPVVLCVPRAGTIKHSRDETSNLHPKLDNSNKKLRLTNKMPENLGSQTDHAGSIDTSHLETQITDEATNIETSREQLFIARIQTLEAEQTKNKARLQEAETRFNYICGRRNKYYTDTVRLEVEVNKLKLKVKELEMNSKDEAEMRKTLEKKIQEDSTKLSEYELTDDRQRLAVEFHTVRARKTSHLLQQALTSLQEGPAS